MKNHKCKLILFANSYFSSIIIIFYFYKFFKIFNQFFNENLVIFLVRCFQMKLVT